MKHIYPMLELCIQGKIRARDLSLLEDKLRHDTIHPLILSEEQRAEIQNILEEMKK